MTASAFSAERETPALPFGNTALLTVFVAAIFISAALLFVVEPMFAKMVLPSLGGAAAVWSVAMAFFQSALLAGYAYAHLLTRFISGRPAVFVHSAVMLLACTALPLHVAAGWDRPPPTNQAFWLLALFAVSIGLPFFALAANGPLLQAWFARSRHPAAKDPYFLFAASNGGSFIALLSYPFFVEPLLPLTQQAWLWSIGFYVLLALVAVCGFLASRSANSTPASSPAHTALPSTAPAWRDVAVWMGISAVPSGLLLAVTAHISTNAAAAPLFWVFPLALYLLTFVIAFQTHPVVPHRLVVRAFPFVVVALTVLVIVSPPTTIVGLVALHLSAFFVIALLCHGELARRRPEPRYLTSFYMWIAAGGTIGGIATALVAPRTFNWIAEYPVLIALAVLCLPGLPQQDRRVGQLILFGAIVAITIPLAVLYAYNLSLDDNVMTLLIGALLGCTLYFWRTPLAFAAIIAFALISSHYQYDGDHGYVVRNFFGVLRVGETPNGKFRILWHGGFGQGAQRIRDDANKPVTGRPEMISEFQAGAGIAQTFDAVRAKVDGPISYAVVGLGTGSLACQARPGDNATYYELDPDIIKIARNPKLFSFVNECRPDIAIVQGDARLTLADAADQSYDLLLVDAFIGAAIPTHLLTKEAIALYLRKLKPRGLLAIHVSNYYLELASVVSASASANGLITREYDGGDVQEDPSQQKWVPRVAAAARDDEDFGILAKSKFWPILPPAPGQRVWTDDYTNVAGALRRRLNEQRRQISGN